MSPTNNQIDSMDKIMESLNSVLSDKQSNPEIIESNTKNEVIPTTVSGDNVMSKIMEGFRDATDNVVTKSSDYPELRSALKTQKTESGSRVGDWDISSRNVDGLGNFYDVSHNVTGGNIATDLRLYEAALALVMALNNGEGINSLKVKTILNVEEDYSRALTDAIGFAARMKICEGVSLDVARARYSESKRKVDTAKKSLAMITKLF